MTLAGRKAVSAVMDTPVDMWLPAVCPPAPHCFLQKSDWGLWDRPPHTGPSPPGGPPAAPGLGEADTGKVSPVTSCKLVEMCAVKSAGELRLKKTVIVLGGDSQP